MIWVAPKMWEDGECWIIGGGFSFPKQFGIPDDIIKKVVGGKLPVTAYSAYLDVICHRHVIGVNNAYMLGSWVDCVFFGDCGWYLVHRLKLAEFPNLKVTCCNRFANKPIEKSEGIKYLAKDSNKRFGISNNPSKVSWNANSGAAAINLAIHFGVKRIILLGFDMNIVDGPAHWHKGHGNKKPPPFARHLKGFPQIAEDAKVLGIEILNANPSSSIDVFPKINVKEVL